MNRDHRIYIPSVINAGLCYKCLKAKEKHEKRGNLENLTIDEAPQRLMCEAT